MIRTLCLAFALLLVAALHGQPGGGPRPEIPPPDDKAAPNPQPDSDAKALAQSAGKMRRIILAMLNFHDAYQGWLPPADYRFFGRPNPPKDGKPLLSWRVAILPF